MTMLSLNDPETPLVQVHLEPPLRCGLSGCGRPTATALAEPSPECAGLWLLLPVCAACRKRLRMGESVNALLSRH